MSRKQVLPLALAFLMVFSTVLVVAPGQAAPASAEQHASIDEGLGVNAPYGTWYPKEEVVPFFLHSDPGTFESANPIYGPVTNATIEHRIPEESGSSAPDSVTITGPTFLATEYVTFVMPDSHMTQNDVLLTEVGVGVYATCDSDSQIGLDFFFYRETFDGTEWVRDDSDFAYVVATSGTGIPYPAVIAPFIGDVAYVEYFSGTDDLGDAIQGSGFRMGPGERITVDVGIDLFGVQCTIYYDTYYSDSLVWVKSVSANVNVWMENHAGTVVDAFPSASAVSSDERLITVNHLQASPWGNHAPWMNTDSFCQGSGCPNYPVNHDDYIQIIDPDTGDILFDGPDQGGHDVDPRDYPITLLDEEIVELSPSVRLRQYTLRYPVDLADGNYRLELQTFGHNIERVPWQVERDFTVGLKDLVLSLAPDEGLTHLVNPGEPTEFALELMNLGAQDDVVTLSASDAGAGWSAKVDPGQVSVPAGKTIPVTLTVTPSEAAFDGQSRSITVTAVSRFGEVAPQTQSVTVDITDQVVHAIDLSSPVTGLLIRPGQEKALGVTLINDGNAADDFLVSTSVPSNVQGWAIQTMPVSTQVAAHSRETVNLLVTAPADAQAGFNFPLTLTAKRVGDAGTQDTLGINVKVFVREGLELVELESGTVRAQREIAGAVCIEGAEPIFCTSDDNPIFGGSVFYPGIVVEDSDYDTTTIHRIALTNTGDREDEYHVEAVWDLDATENERDAASCNDGVYVDGIAPPLLGGDPDGVPDGWRFNYQDLISNPLPDSGSPQRGEESKDGFSGYIQLNDTANPFVVPAHSTRYIYFEIGYLEGDVCPNNENVNTAPERVTDTFSAEAALTVRVESLNDPSIGKEVTLVNKMEAQGDFLGRNHYSGAFRDVLVEPELDTSTEVPAPENGAGVFDLRAINTGNELDDLVIFVSDADPDWDYQIVVDDGHVPSTLVCDPVEASGLQVRCPNVGIYDEVAFHVEATPNVTKGVRIGDRSEFEVTVRSGDDTNIRHSIDLETRLAGSFAYDVLFTENDLSAVPGEAVSFPFTIDNLGTEDDTYTLSITEGDLDFRPQFSTVREVFVPAGHSFSGFVTVTVPDDATLGEKASFEIRVDSPNVGAQEPDFFVTPIAAPQLSLSGYDGSSAITEVLLTERGVATTVQFIATDLTGASGNSVTFTVDPEALPAGWTVTPTSQTDVLVKESGAALATAVASFEVTAPEDALGTTRVPLRATATTDHSPAMERSADLILDLASTFGIGLEPVLDSAQTIIPGGDVVYTIRVNNTGLASDTVTITTSTPPEGWDVFVTPVEVGLGPLETREVQVKVEAPADAEPAALATIAVFAMSAGDPTQVADLELVTEVGFYDLRIDGPPGIAYIAPQETAVQVFRVNNTGTLLDDVDLDPVLLTTQGAADVELTVDSDPVEVRPGEAEQIRVGVTVGETIPAGTSLAVELQGTSILDIQDPPAAASANTTVEILPYRAVDVDGDLLAEFAIDRNRDSGDGLESFRENLNEGGKTSVALSMTGFLSDEAIADHTVQVADEDGETTEIVRLLIDGDEDGRPDLFLDTGGDGLPDVYWDPDLDTSVDLDILRDVDGDGVLDYFVDADADGDADVVYDLRTGIFTDLIQVDIDGDGDLDFVVDSDGDGQLGDDETVLLSSTGGLTTIVKVDVTGNGELDDVVDDDGDGNPDYFVPAGSEDGIDIKLKDVTGDGELDWTYDADGDGRVDSYYDPVTGEAATIDATENLLDLMKEYWFVLALFGLVAILFVALLAVTRR